MEAFSAPLDQTSSPAVPVGDSEKASVAGLRKTFILAGDFFDPHSYPVLFAEALAREQHAHLVCASSVDPTLCLPAPPDNLPSLEQRHHDPDARTELPELNSGASAHSHNTSDRDRHLDAIEAMVREHRPAMLLLGTQAHSEAARAMLGCVARRFVLHCACPVLVIGPPDACAVPHARPWQRVLVATDFSSPATAALLLAHTLVGSEMVALHCRPEEETAVSANIWLEKLRFLAPFNESHTVPVEHVVQTGEPGHLIRTLAAEIRPDLIVLGSPSAELTDAELAGSTVCNVVEHAHCPVLLIPPPHPAAHVEPEEVEVCA